MEEEEDIRFHFKGGGVKMTQKEEQLKMLISKMLSYLTSIMLLTDDGSIARETDKFEAKLKEIEEGR